MAVRLTKRLVQHAVGPEIKVPADRTRSKWIGDSEVCGFGVRILGSGRKIFGLGFRTRAGRARWLAQRLIISLVMLPDDGLVAYSYAIYLREVVVPFRDLVDVVKPDGTGVIQITDGEGLNIQPDWGGDGWI